MGAPEPTTNARSPATSTARPGRQFSPGGASASVGWREPATMRSSTTARMCPSASTSASRAAPIASRAASRSTRASAVRPTATGCWSSGSERTSLRATGSIANNPVSSTPTIRRGVSQAATWICPFRVFTSPTVRIRVTSTIRTPSARSTPIASRFPSGERAHAPGLGPSATRLPRTGFRLPRWRRTSSEPDRPADRIASTVAGRFAAGRSGATRVVGSATPRASRATATVRGATLTCLLRLTAEAGSRKRFA